MLIGLMMGLSLAGFANEVPVVMQSGIGGSLIEEREVETGAAMTTVAAPSVVGYIFTGWTSCDTSVFPARDRLDRVLESAKQTVYGETLLTANYVADDVDSDNDGIADSHELYWYGNLDETAGSDANRDGYDFAAELAGGRTLSWRIAASRRIRLPKTSHGGAVAAARQTKPLPHGISGQGWLPPRRGAVFDIMGGMKDINTPIFDFPSLRDPESDFVKRSRT